MSLFLERLKFIGLHLRTRIKHYVLSYMEYSKTISTYTFKSRLSDQFDKGKLCLQIGHRIFS